MIYRLAAFVAAILVATNLPAHALAAPQFSIKELGDVDSSQAIAYGINNKGDIVGESDNLLVGGNAGAAFWPRVNHTTFIDPDLGSILSAASDINKDGVAVGFKYNAGTGIRAYVWGNNTATALPSLHSNPDLYANDDADEVNDSGQIVGYSTEDNGNVHAVTWINSTTLVDLTPDPDTEAAGAFGINNTGDITGNWNRQAVIWQSGSMTILPIPRPADIPADATLFVDGRSIADNGDVAGYISWSSEATGTGGYRAFLWSGGNATILQPFDPNYPECIAYGVNNKQEIVGGCANAQTGQTRAFYWKGGTMYDPGMLADGVSSYAEAINDKGEFVGYVAHDNGVYSAVAWH